jgi:hypothetical protein
MRGGFKGSTQNPSGRRDLVDDIGSGITEHAFGSDSEDLNNALFICCNAGEVGAVEDGVLEGLSLDLFAFSTLRRKLLFGPQRRPSSATHGSLIMDSHHSSGPHIRKATCAAHYARSVISTSRFGAVERGGWNSATGRRTFTRSAGTALGRFIGKQWAAQAALIGPSLLKA